MLLLADGTRFCSSALITNACQNLTPNILTAFHCVDVSQDGSISSEEQSSVNSWVFRFQYKSPSCSGGDGTSYYSFSGSQLAASYRPSDFALLQMYQRPQDYTNIRYAGWSRTTSAASSSAGIHHPAGDVMKISLSSTSPSSYSWFGGGNEHWGVQFTQGTVQPGSSGSPLFNQDHRIVG